MHRVWARRRAWRKRLQGALLGLLLLLPLTLLVHPAWGLLSLLALAYPARREERAALADLDRKYGLAYRSALEAPPDHPWRGRLEAEASASLSRAQPPAFPWPLALVYLALVGLIWVLPPLQIPARFSSPQTSPTTPPIPPPQTSPGTTEQAPTNPAPTGQNPPSDEPTERASPGQAPQPTPPGQATPPSEGSPPQPSSGRAPTPQNPQNPPSPGQSPTATQPGQTGQAQPSPNPPGQPSDARPDQPGPPGQGPQQQPGPEQTAQPGQPSKANPPGSGQNGQPSPASPEQPREGTPQQPQGPGSQQQGQSTPSSPPSERGSGPARQPLPQITNPRPNGEAPIRRGPSQGQPLPNPWPSAQPPQNVQRQAENYLENEPLPPEVREVLRRYFELPADGP